MKLIMATHNINKVKEVKAILNKDNIISLTDLNDFKEIEETGNTFFENATIKALEIAKKYNEVAIADDSGIVIKALNGAPGLYSVRYSGKGDLENNLLVLKQLETVKDRSAYFISVIALAYPDGKVLKFEGKWEGKIGFEIKGNQGFGYDSIFIPNGYEITAGELNSKEKNQISHRYQALMKLNEYLK
ncbi:MAG: RdgB/HAM1 family non-canonical purine NTP pyrophosphatase [Acholeplasma sp.]|nr:RdgB/HAM1 family non-canonical purine NTP pyrophosphatase [Acholeplasma sp.]